MSDLIAADPDVPDGFHLRASRATIPPGGTVLGRLDSLRCEQLSAMKARTAAGDVF
jgi:hypothetical protein